MTEVPPKVPFPRGDVYWTVCICRGLDIPTFSKYVIKRQITNIMHQSKRKIVEYSFENIRQREHFLHDAALENLRHSCMKRFL
jgi:hypothetical protein